MEELLARSELAGQQELSDFISAASSLNGPLSSFENDNDMLSRISFRFAFYVLPDPLSVQNESKTLLVLLLAAELLKGGGQKKADARKKSTKSSGTFRSIKLCFRRFIYIFFQLTQCYADV